MRHKCYISFKTEDKGYKKEIQSMGIDMIDKSLNVAIKSMNKDYIMRKIREDYLADSTVTIFLIGCYSAENSPDQDQTYIKRELQASLYNGDNNSRNGILGIVLPEMISSIYKGTYSCSACNGTHNLVLINDSTTIKEFHRNYYIQPCPGCCWTENDRYCVLVKWEDFKSDPEKYIDQAYDKRFAPIAQRVTVYPK